jgi:uncharacterized membrane protein
MTLTLILTPGILLFFSFILILSLIFLFWISVQYRRKSRCLDDIERMTAMEMIKIRKKTSRG